MKRYILTGAPGSGKTEILRRLAVLGHAVVEEAATDVIAREHAQGVDEAWTHPRFIEAIARLQRRRQMAAAGRDDAVQFYDHSPVCTLALCRFLGHAVPTCLNRELDRMARDSVYERSVFFVDPLGFIAPTAARRISYEDALRFETVHRQAYGELGYQCVGVAAGPVEGRALAIQRWVFGPAA